MDRKTVIEHSRVNRVVVVDVRFCEVLALWQDYSYRPPGYMEDLFERDRLTRPYTDRARDSCSTASRGTATIN